MRQYLIPVLFLLLLSSCRSFDQPQTELVNRKLKEEDLDVRVYKTVDDRELVLHLFYPEDYSAESDKRYPAAASFHGGAWTFGPVEWGDGDARYMASLGYVGVAVEYRLADYKNVSALDCMKDANSAIRWIRIHGDELNIDTGRIVTIGHSSGGHLALSTAFFPQFREPSEDETISSVPNAVIALAPAVALDRDGYFQDLLLGQTTARACSPIDNIMKLNLPILVIQGTDDELLPVEYTKEFVSDMKDAGNDIRLSLYQGGSHGFFYENSEGQDFYQNAIRNFILNLEQ